MRAIFLYFTLAALIISAFACTPQVKEQQEEADTKVVSTETKADKIEVYYFHNTRRCATCNAVEDVTKNTLKEFFADEMNSGKITFKSLNIEEEAGETMAQKLEISGQTLLFVAGNSKVDLTNTAFLTAKASPDKLKNKVKSTVEEFLAKMI